MHTAGPPSLPHVIIVFTGIPLFAVSTVTQTAEVLCVAQDVQVPRL